MYFVTRKAFLNISASFYVNFYFICCVINLHKLCFILDSEIFSLLHGNSKKTVITDERDIDNSLEKMIGYDEKTFSSIVSSSENSDDNFASSSTKHSDKKDSVTDNEVFGHDRNFEKIKKETERAEKTGYKRNDLFFQDPRVQVQEETGSQRVQVSNGYQEPFSQQMGPSGRVSSGQLIEWSLTFYGTGHEEEDN